jgi:uncharacterized protein (TIGR02266 family)
MMQMHRKAPRFRVHLSVRYGSARDFVMDYAENMSSGGLFIRGAHDFAPGHRLRVEIDLPGFDTFTVSAEVAHVLGPEAAAACGRQAGVGLAIVQAPEGFSEAMHQYLLRLGKRRDYIVLVEEPGIRHLFAEAGYQVRPLPLSSSLRTALEGSLFPVVGVVVTRASLGPFAAATAAAGVPRLLHTIDSPEEFDDLLRIIDQDLEP